MSTNIPDAKNSSKSLTSSLIELWKEFIPLSLTDMAMAFGEPVRNFAMAKLPQADLSIASVGVAKNLAVFFESPIIMILHASNALAKDGRSSKLLLKFTLIFSLILAAIFLVLGLPDIFHFVASDIFSIQIEISNETRKIIGMIFLWPFIIGWRRYFQGLLIQNKKNYVVASASLVRLVFVIGLPLVGMQLGWSGILCAVSSLLVGIIAESLYVTIWSIKKGLFSETMERRKENLPQNYKSIIKYYFPLAISMIVIWGTRALLVFLLGRAIDSHTSLIVWPVVWGLITVVSNGTRMVQQVYIAHKESYSKDEISWFILSVGFAFSLILMGLIYTPFGQTLIHYSMGNISELYPQVTTALSSFLIFPLLTTLQNVLQGELIWSGNTPIIGRAAWVSNLLIIGIAVGCIFYQVSGVASLSWALNLGLLCEILFYYIYLKKS